jgi:hypothetical protein
MVTMPRPTLILVCLACLYAGWVVRSEVPMSPLEQRPILAAVVRFAKTALWFAAFAEPAPPDSRAVEVQSVMVDEQGYAHLNHARGW